MTNIPTVSFVPEIAPQFELFWGKPDILPSGDRRSCFHSHMGLWAMEPTSLRTRADMVIARLHPENDLSRELKAEFFSNAIGELSLASEEKYTAVVPIHGAITKKRSKFAEASALETRKMVRQLASDPAVEKIVLHIDSPGGAVSGISDLAEEIKAATKIKPVVAYIEDMGASAAYWIASQCTEIVANEGAFVGSLGTYGVIHDVSGAYERQGVKVHLISSGGIKGKGIEGTVIGEEVLADQQRIVDTINALFKSSVAAGRNFGQKKIDDLFDGRVHGADEALRMGLIDRIGSFDSVFAEGDKPEDKEEEPEEEEEEEEMPEEKKSHLAEDIEILAAEVKKAGSPYSVESIKAKLLAATKGVEDEIKALEAAEAVAERLSKVRKFVGEHAPEEAEKKAEVLPAKYEDLTAEYKAKMKLARESGVAPEKLVSHMKDKYPELVEKMCAKATENWHKRFSK